MVQAPDSNEIITGLDLTPFIEHPGNEDYILGIYAIRTKENRAEYLPTSEALRVEILSSNGGMVWNSGMGKNFLQMTSPVYPEKPGDIYKYYVNWNGKSTKGGRLPNGVYKARMIIPAKPIPYILTTELNLE